MGRSGGAASGGSRFIRHVHRDMPIKVLVHARQVQFPDAKPQMVNNQVLVLIRFVSDKLGGKLELNGKVITIVKGDHTAQLTIGSKTVTANGTTMTLDIAANATGVRTYVPLRFISEALGEKVQWDQVARFVWIGSLDVPELRDVVKPVSLEPFMPYFMEGTL